MDTQGNHILFGKHDKDGSPRGMASRTRAAAKGETRPLANTGANGYDVAVVGAGMAGMATAARLQAAGLRTLVLEAHGVPGGCAGFFRRAGFAFDVRATTLVDFEPGGVGGELLATIAMPPLTRDVLRRQTHPKSCLSGRTPHQRHGRSPYRFASEAALYARIRVAHPERQSSASTG